MALPEAHAPTTSPTSRGSRPRAPRAPARAAPQGMRCVYPPGGGRAAVEVWADDLNRLEPQEFLNDTVIDFYMR